MIFFFFFLFMISCQQSNNEPVSRMLAAPMERYNVIDVSGSTVETRFEVPDGFKRTSVQENSFASFLRNLPLKPSGSKVKYFNGEEKDNAVYDAVVDFDLGRRDLQQCADAIIRLRAEYFYSLGQFDNISFKLTNGFKVEYAEWMKGNRVMVDGNRTWWKKMTQPSNTASDFRSYLEFVFTYAGTLSLSKELHSKNVNDLAIGDVFIQGGSPGHAIIVVDMAANEAGKKVFLLAQSYMPAQDIQILKNFNDKKISPWYSADIQNRLETPQWTFTLDQLKAW